MTGLTTTPAAFDFQFGALDNTDNEVTKAYHNML